ncbi:MAG: biopolymer transporter ExbD, partial [Gammaproteobacteria bacterium]
MKESHRTRRMERHHKRNKKTATLNMVSMMDIFTILVFFLLVSAGNQQNLPDLK